MAINRETGQATYDELYEKRRFGRFDIAKEFYECESDLLQKIFARVLPVHVEFDYCTNTFNIKALSKDFHPVEAGAVMPYYLVVAQVLDNGEISVSFKQT